MQTQARQLDSLLHGLQNAESAFLSLAAVSSDAVVVADSRGCVAMMNPRAEQLIGISPLEAIGQPIAEILPLAEPQQSRQRGDDDAQPMWPAALLLKRRTGASTHVNVHTKSLAAMNAGYAGWLLYVLSEQGTRPPAASGLDFNHRADFMVALDAAIADAERTETEYALLYIKADQVEAMNRVAGMEARERFGARLARVLQLVKSDTTRTAQLDGGAFAILARHKSLSDAQILARILHQALHATDSEHEEKSEPATISVGIAPVTATALDAESALSEATAACRRAYEDGGNRTVTMSADSSGLMRRREEIRWMGVLSQALDEDTASVVAHRLLPLDATRSSPVHYDLELQVLDEQTQQPFPTDRLLSAATQFGLRSSVDRWLIGTLLPQIATATSSNAVEADAVFVIPMSEVSLRDAAMLAFLRRRIHDCGVAPERLVFRVTEPSLNSHAVTAIRLLNGIRQMGCKVMVENVGGVSSSFAHLKSLPTDYLALDCALVASFPLQRTDQAMLAAIKQWATVLGLQCIACGVDSSAALPLLREIGIDWVKGHAAGEPRVIRVREGW